MRIVGNIILILVCLFIGYHIIAIFGMNKAIVMGKILLLIVMITIGISLREGINPFKINRK